MVREAAADVAAKRKAGLALIAAHGDRRIYREDACGAYMEARYWLKTYRERLAAIHPEKFNGWSPARLKRHADRHL